MTGTTTQTATARRWRLVAEFALLFLGVPLLLALVLPPTAMFTVLGAMTLGGMVLLHLTPGFSWTELLHGWRELPGRAVAVFVAVTLLTAFAGVMILFPHNLLMLPRLDPGLWLLILVAYPVVSALPQEMLFRPLFFRRYGPLFPDTRVAILANAALFSFAHLMYWHWLVAAMTFCGGLAFAWAYAVRGNFPLAVILHALAGQIVFTSGLGILFYSGAVN